MQASELILNADNSIYHLGLRTDQLAPIVLLVGDPDRTAKISRYFDAVEHRAAHREFITHTGRIGGKRLSVVSTGIGTDNIDIVLNELDALINIDLEKRQPKTETTSLKIIRLGTTGSLQASVGVDAFVASSAAFGMDGLMHFYNAPQQQNHPALDALRAHTGNDWTFPVAPYFAEGDKNLLNLFSNGASIGITATNSGFYGPQGRQLRAKVKQPRYLDLLANFEFQQQKIVNLEMETAAIYGLSEMLGHQALSLSVVLANRPLGQFSPSPGQSVEKLIVWALEKIADNDI